MAIDVCSEIPSLSISPRISFSLDPNQTNLLLLEDQDHDRHRHDRRRLDSSSDFDFCIVTEDDFTFEISSADELFSDGKILPAEIKSKEHSQKFPDPPEPPPTSTARINNNSSSTDPEEIKKINLTECVPKIPKPSNLISTSTVDNTNSTGPNPDEKRFKLIKKPGQTSSLLTSTARDSSSSTGSSEKKITRLKELLSLSFDTDDDENEDDNKKTRRNSGGGGGSSNSYKSFWQFRRSSSLNLEKIKSLHFISRSNSTGSVRPVGPQKPKPGLRKQQSLNASSPGSGRAASYYKRTSSFSGGTNYNYYNNAVPSKGVPRKNNSCGSQYYNGGRMVSPVLNLPQPYISKVTVSFFGFGSLFCNGKLRKKK